MKNLYRSILIILLIGISLLLYITINAEYQGNAMEESVLAGETIVENPVYSAESDESISEYNEGTDYEDDTEDTSVQMVIPSGEPIGIYVKTEGVMVIDTTEITTQDGKTTAPCEGLFMPGDYIVGVNGENVQDKNHLTHIIENCMGEDLTIDIIRNGENIQVTVTPKRSQGKYMLGLWVKDDISGIGTMTYIDENGFAALGHSINDNDTGTVMSISDGAIYDTDLINIVKSDGENPGRLEGLIDYSKENIMGRVEENHQFGISGYMTKNGAEKMTDGEWIPVAQKEEARMGEAYILSCITGEPIYYKIEITGVDISSSAGNKGLEIKITDERLLGITNGIVQGMSGTPIIQDGKLLGAITHVFVKDSTRGYGTFVEDMME